MGQRDSPSPKPKALACLLTRGIILWAGWWGGKSTMPKREDEYWAGKKEPKGRGLCPRCGNSNISYNERFQSWRCNKCERSFPTPSYGPGGDFGKEARWFGKTTGG